MATTWNCSDAKTCFEWTETYAIGFGQIDREHQRLFALAEAMQLAMMAGKGKAFLGTLLAALLDYAGYHFAHEEALMERLGYPALPEHRRQHDALRTRVRELQKRADSGEITMTMEVAAFLIDWLKRHTTDEDRKIATHRGGAKSPRPGDENDTRGE